VRKEETGKRRSPGSLVPILAMWLAAVVGMAAIPVGREASLFRRAEEAWAHERTVAETLRECPLPGLCW
jgi:hypothetical protein